MADRKQPTPPPSPSAKPAPPPAPPFHALAQMAIDERKAHLETIRIARNLYEAVSRGYYDGEVTAMRDRLTDLDIKHIKERLG